jgi:precorrin-6B methylase 2
MEKGYKRIIEVGVGPGPVTAAIALTKPEVLVGIDDERSNVLIRDVKKIVTQDFFKGIVAKSEEALPIMVGPYDLLVHDGSHTYESVLGDCREAVRLGVKHIIVHDSYMRVVDDAIRDLGLPNCSLIDFGQCLGGPYGAARLICRA